MKFHKLAFIVILLTLSLSACTDRPGNLAAGKSRIKVQCTGFMLDSMLIEVTDAAGNKMGNSQDLSCVLYDAVYFDVPVPPYGFDVYLDNSLYQQVTFNSAGEEIVVRVDGLIIPAL